MANMNGRNVANTTGWANMTNWGATMLKTTLVAGSIMATLLGANLAARQEQAATLTPQFTVAQATGTTGQAPRVLTAVPNLPAASNLNAVDLDKLLNQPLAPMPSIAPPAPVARSRSSR